MKRTSVIVIAMLLAAGSAVAQFPGGGMGGMGGGRRGGMGGMGGAGGRGGMAGGAREMNVKFPSAKSLEKYNPAALLLDKHKKLKLADAQQTQLTGLRLQIFERNATLLARYDSVQRDFHMPQASQRRGEEPSPAADSTRRTAMREMRELRQLADSLQDRRRADVRDVLTALADDTQRKQAAEYLDKQDIEFSKEFPAPPQQRGQGDSTSMGGRGRGRGGARPPV